MNESAFNPNHSPSLGTAFKVRSKHARLLKIQNCSAETVLNLEYGQGLIFGQGHRKGDFMEVVVFLNGKKHTGYMNLKDIQITSQYHAKPTVSFCNINLKPSRLITLNQNSGRAFPLNSEFMPFRNPKASSKAKRESLDQIISYLSVSKSLRYRAQRDKETGKALTYCNIYAYDYGCLAKAYIPRVWWNSEALKQIKSGRKQSIQYGETVREMRANDLFYWFPEFGKKCGWRPVSKGIKAYQRLQLAANHGNIGIILAHNRNGSGHISIVVPEKGKHKALRNPEDGKILCPLQSSAGAKNFQYQSDNPGWEKRQTFDDYSYWIHSAPSCNPSNIFKFLNRIRNSIHSFLKAI